MQANITELKEKTIALVKEAAQITEAAFQVAEKDSPANIVTSADTAVQAFLEQQLCPLIPGSVLFGEEGNSITGSADYQWIVDPIDGTANFSRGIGEYAISVGLMHRGEILLGVVYNPVQDKLYSAQAGGGAYCNGKPLHVSSVPFEKGLLCTALSLYRKEYAAKCMDVIMEVYARCNDVRRFGSCAMELCYLAEGKCDLYFEFRVFPWDYAGAYLILKEAGGSIGGHDGQPLTFDRATPVVAANTTENFQALVSIVQKHIKTIPYCEVFQ